MVKVMAIDGAGEGLSEDIREIVPVDFPLSSFDLDLEQMRIQIQELDAVAGARIQIRAGGVLQVDVDERLPAVLWRTRDGITALDETGHVVAPVISRADFPALPLIAGEGADLVVPEALAILAAATPLASRLRGLVRMGERRWDVVLDRDQRILLPEQDAVAALERVIVLNEAQDMLARDLVAIDMRNEHRPTIRLTEHAVEEVRNIKAIELGVAH
jgi:cell division protein FtsQ